MLDIFKYLPKFISLLIYKVWFKNKLLGMTTLKEQRYFQSAAKEMSSSYGVVVDLGCWLGSTTISLATGVKEINQPITTKIYALDRFIWSPFMNRYLSFVKKDYHVGDNFIAETIQRTSKHADIIEIVQADLSNYKWSQGEIKLLLIDAMKTPALTKKILSSFFPFLTKDSLVIHQDFKFYGTPWLHIVQYRLKNFFRLELNVEEGTTVVFRTLKKITPIVCEQVGDFSELTDKEVSDAFYYSSSLVNKKEIGMIASAHVQFHFTQYELKKGNELIRKYEKEGITFKRPVVMGC